MKIQKLSIKKLKPAKYNPRKDLKPGDPEYEKLKRSIDEFDLVEPLVWNKRTGNLVGGHQRLKILIERGDTECDVSVVDFSEAKEKALNVALNKISGDWDTLKLHDLFLNLEELDIDLDITGFDVEEREIIHNDADPQEPEEVPTPDLPEKATSKRGDIFVLGSHRLMCGDATIKEDVEALMAGEKADMVFTDPPYGVDYSSKNVFLDAIGKANCVKEDIIGDKQTIDDMKILWTLTFTRALEVTKQGGTYYFCAPSGGELMMMMMSVLEAGWELKHIIIWKKNNIVLGRSDYNYQHESLLYGWKKGSHKFYGPKGASSVWEIDKPHQSKLHPTMKPIELCAKAIKNSSLKGQIILDLFGGSGSTLIACEQLDRRCYMMEIDERYCDVIVNRWEDFTGKKAVKLNKTMGAG